MLEPVRGHYSRLGLPRVKLDFAVRQGVRARLNVVVDTGFSAGLIVYSNWARFINANLTDRVTKLTVANGEKWDGIYAYCILNWFGNLQETEIIIADREARSIDSEAGLLGMKMLRNTKLIFELGQVRIEKL